MKLSISEIVRLSLIGKMSQDKVSNPYPIGMILNNGISVDFLTVKGEMFTVTKIFLGGAIVASDSVQNGGQTDITYLIENLELTLNK